MNKFYLIALLIGCSFRATAQNSDPYKVFGHTSKVKYEERRTDWLYIPNKDTTSYIKAIAFNMSKSQAQLIGRNDSVIQIMMMTGDKLLRWMSVDPLANKYPSFSPYNFVTNNPMRFIDPKGAAPEDIVVTTKAGKELFRLDDGKTEITTMTAKQLYDKGTQWFEPLADKYMPLKSMSADIGTTSELKHFTWNQIDEFASEDRWMISYRQGGSGDWKASKKGGDGYLMVTVGGQPYWADAIGQIPFAVDYFTDRLEKHGDKEKALKETVKKGREYGEGKLFGGSEDKSNGYDTYFILRGALYAADKYVKTDDGLKENSNGYNPNNLGGRIWYKDAIPYLGLNPKQ